LGSRCTQASNAAKLSRRSPRRSRWISLLEAYHYRGLALLGLGEDKSGQRPVSGHQANTQSFQLNLDFSQALLVANRLNDALARSTGLKFCQDRF
jgi:hypothetical protein